MNIFCLSTGRCGSTTFSKSFSYLTNYTSGHETRSQKIGPTRFEYPDQHIESDNRLSWMLGSLDHKYGDQSIYVHLWRDKHEVATSYAKRYSSTWIAGIMHGFGHGILMRGSTYSEEEIYSLASMYVDVVENNIKQFLKDKSKVVEISMHDPYKGIDELWELANFKGNKSLCYAEWSTKHNSSPN